MPRIFRANDFILSDEIFTISEEDEGFEEDPVYSEFSGEQGEREEATEEEAAEAAARLERERLEALAREQAEEILDEARAQAQQILADTRQEIEAMRETARAQAEAQAEELRQQGYNDGFETGMAEGARQKTGEILKCIGDLEDGVGRIEGEQAGFMAEYEHSLKWLAWEIASKVLGKKLAEDDRELASLVKAAVASVKKAEWITIEVSDKMTGLIDLLTQELRKAGEERVDVRGIVAPDGTCIVDTPSGLIDASVYTQMENLRIYFAQEDEEQE